jgi:hypothetical protein
MWDNKSDFLWLLLALLYIFILIQPNTKALVAQNYYPKFLSTYLFSIKFLYYLMRIRVNIWHLIGRLNQRAADGFLPLRAFKPSSSDSADRGRSIIRVRVRLTRIIQSLYQNKHAEWLCTCLCIFRKQIHLYSHNYDLNCHRFTNL